MMERVEGNLRECPFCGGPPSVERTVVAPGYYIGCVSCKLWIGDPDPIELEVRWNKRASA